jgi:uncharacterized protein YeeX (DUF496 family)
MSEAERVVEINQIKDKIAEWQTAKLKLERDLGEVTNKIRTSGRLPQLEYVRLCNRQNTLKREVADILDTMAKLKSQLRIASSKKDILTIERQSISSLSDSLSDLDFVFGRIRLLRDSHLRFSEDLTRVSSMRTISAQIARELTELIGELQQRRDSILQKKSQNE